MLEKSKILFFKNFDKISKKENQGDNFFYYDMDFEILKKFRNFIFEIKKKDLMKICDEYLFNKICEDKTSKVIFGSNDNNLEALVSRGWEIELFSDVLSYKKNKGDY